MSAIDDFCHGHGNGTLCKIEETVQGWVHEKEVDDLLETQVGDGVLLGDLLSGDGLQDQVSPDLLKGFSELMKGKVNSYDDVRRILLEKLDKNEASV